VSLEKSHNCREKHIESIVTSFLHWRIVLKIANVYIAPHAPLEEIMHSVQRILEKVKKKTHFTF